MKGLAYLVVMLGLVFLCGMASFFAIPSDPYNGMSPADLSATAACLFLTAEGNYFGYEVYGSPTPRPDSTATPTLIAGAAERGQVLFHGAANCSTCHSVADEDMIVGPSLRSIAGRAGFRREGMNAEEYLYNAIINPWDVIPSMGKPRIMPRTYLQQLEQQEIADLVAYLLTLKG